MASQSSFILEMKCTIHLPVVFISLLVVWVRSKTFTRCELAKELLKQGFPKYQLKDWICLVEAESSRRTDVVGGPDDDGSYDYGLFQINDRYWCSTGKPGNECHVKCEDLLADNITTAALCSKKIYRIQGFDAWVGWVNDCQSQLPDLKDCLLQ